MATTTTTLKATFALDTGKTKTYNLPDPKPGLDRAAVEPALQAFVTGDLIRVGTAGVTSIASCIIRQVSETKLI